MNRKVLIIGGAGFIGQNLLRTLLKQNFFVRVLDNFNSQVHVKEYFPTDLHGNFDLIRGDVRDRDLIRRALIGIDVVVHLAAETGTGQSMYDIERYFSVNVLGTATLLDVIQNDVCANSVESIIVASSRAIYGEGAYNCVIHGLVYPAHRTRELMSDGRFDPLCPYCDRRASVFPTPESAPFNPMSMYGLTKQMQEQAVLLFARTRGINGFGLRYQNVYGPGQSLKNPYTGILAVFSNLARQHQLIEIYEDGLESRDFVYIDDVIDATVRGINYPERFVGSLNVGSGVATNVITVAQEIKAFFNSESMINVTGKFRMGDIRHNIADLTNIEKIFGLVPEVPFKQGLSNFLEWADTQAPEDKEAYIRSVGELASRDLMGIHLQRK